MGHREDDVNTCVYDKTDKGREEIATRKYHIPPRLRSLLVMIDGRRSLDSLLSNFSAIGVTEESVNELLRDEYIAVVGTAAPPAPRPAPPARAPVIDALHEATLPEPVISAPLLSEQERIAALYDFYNQTIKSTIGLRGVMLQLKVEKCASVADFRELRLAYLEGVLKAKGREMALSLRDRLDHLLGGKPPSDAFDPD